MKPEPCPCQSKKNYQDCCQRYHKDPSKIPTTEHLLRARYTAFVYKLPSFIKQTMIEPAIKAYDENNQKDEFIGQLQRGKVSDETKRL